MKIIKAEEPLLVTSIKMLIYGEPGAGKTSLAFSAEKPLCLDFDRGAHRSAFRKDSVRVESWSEVAVINPADVSGYKTLVVDTVGRQLDMIAAHVIRNNRKLSTKAGNLTLQGYGELKAVFAQWVKMVEQLGLDLIFVAHNKEEKDGDSIIMRPDIQGSSYQEVFKVADALGYVRILNRKRTVDFEPTEQHVGKDTAKIGLVEVPNLHNVPTFGGDLISRIKDSINNASDAGKAATEAIEAYRLKLDGCQDLGKLNDIRLSISSIDDDTVKSKSKELLVHKMHAMGAAWSKEKECFVIVEQVQVDSEEQPRSLEWWIDKVDAVESDLLSWWEVESGPASNDLNPDEMKKLNSYVSQLIDIAGEEAGKSDESCQKNDGIEPLMAEVDALKTSVAVDRWRASKSASIVKSFNQADQDKIFEYADNAYNMLKKAEEER